MKKFTIGRFTCTELRACTVFNFAPVADTGGAQGACFMLHLRVRLL